MQLAKARYSEIAVGYTKAQEPTLVNIAWNN